MNTSGPITEEIFEHRRTIQNLKDFMASENYTPDEIKRFNAAVEDRNDHLMNLLICRMRIPDKNKVVLKCLNHWIMWHKVRKTMKYYLRLANCNVQYFKCDVR